MVNILILKGDISEQEVDAIVNPANKWLGKGGGVTGAIHRKAGPKFTEECAFIGRCETGEVKLTNGHNLPAKHVIHTVGPEYGYENGKEPEILRQCYEKILSLSLEKGFKTVSFPAISVGSFRYPEKEATEIAIQTTKEFLSKLDKNRQLSINEVRFVVFSDELYFLYKTILSKYASN